MITTIIDGKIYDITDFVNTHPGGREMIRLAENRDSTITNIPKDKYRNIIKGAYERPEKYVSNKNKTRKIKKNYL